MASSSVVMGKMGELDNKDYPEDSFINDDSDADVTCNKWGLASKQVRELILMNIKKENTIKV